MNILLFNYRLKIIITQQDDLVIAEICNMAKQKKPTDLQCGFPKDNLNFVSKLDLLIVMFVDH